MSAKETQENMVEVSMEEALGIHVNTPSNGKLGLNLITKNPRIAIDRHEMPLQNVTTITKLGIAAFYLKLLKGDADFCVITSPNVTGQREVSVNFNKQISFQVALECFFLFAWGAITSASRQVYLAYGLKLDWNQVSFYPVIQRLRIEYPKSEITAYFEKLNSDEWFVYLNRSRNRVEHGQMPTFEFKGQEGIVVLADDPSVKNKDVTTNKLYKPVDVCQNIFTLVEKFVDDVSFDLNRLLYE